MNQYILSAQWNPAPWVTVLLAWSVKQTNKDTWLVVWLKRGNACKVFRMISMTIQYLVVYYYFVCVGFTGLLAGKGVLSRMLGEAGWAVWRYPRGSPLLCLDAPRAGVSPALCPDPLRA